MGLKWTNYVLPIIYWLLMTLGQVNILAIFFYRYKKHLGHDEIGLRIAEILELSIFQLMWWLAIASHLRSMLANPGHT
jgi:hypothetical protein